MKKIFSYKLYFSAAVLGLFASCTDLDSDDSGRLVKPVITVQQTSYSVTEGDTVWITLTADKALTTPMDFKLNLNETSTADFRDYTSIGEESTITTGAGTIGHLITMPAYATTFTFWVLPTLDLKTESTEVLNFRLYGESNSAGVVANEDITVTVANGTSDDFIVEMIWNGDYPDAFGSIVPTTYTGVDEQEHEYCDFDFDIEIYDDTFTPVFVDYNNCPAITGIPFDAPDGEYTIVPSFWDNISSAGAVPASGDIIYPVMVTMGKPGVFEHTTDLTGSFSYAAGGANNGNADAYIPIATVTKTGTTYVLKDFNDPTIILGQGRLAQIKNFLQNRKQGKH